MADTTVPKLSPLFGAAKTISPLFKNDGGVQVIVAPAARRKIAIISEEYQNVRALSASPGHVDVDLVDNIDFEWNEPARTLISRALSKSPHAIQT